MNSNFAQRVSVLIDYVCNTYAFALLCVGAVLLLWYLGYDSLAFTVGLALFVVVVVVHILKLTIRAKRLDGALVETRLGAFPSGHAAASASIAVLVPYTASVIEPSAVLPLGFFVALVALLVSISRVVVRAHTPFQVFVGALLGVVLPIATIFVAA
jgi:membrane-associated phospholipid phosphatase